MGSTSDPAHDQLLKLVCSYDQALASGEAVDESLPADAPDGVRPRLQGLQSCLRFLETVWPRQPGGASDPVDIWDPAPFSLKDIPVRLGRFEILRELGSGRFGLVLEAFDPALGRHVALKVPRPEVLITAGLRARFLREGNVVARLDHAHIVPVHDAGEENGVCYLVSD